MYPEAVAFAEEALTVTNACNHNPTTDPERRLALLQSISQTAINLLSIAGSDDRDAVESLYSQLSCILSEFRSLSVDCNSLNHPKKRQMCDDAQLLPTEIVLLCVCSIPDPFHRFTRGQIFPRLNRTTHRMIIDAPHLLGEFSLHSKTFAQTKNREKPRYLGLVDVSGWVNDRELAFFLPPFSMQIGAFLRHSQYMTAG